MTPELQSLLDTLSGQHGWIAAGLSWIASARILLKPINAWLLAKMERAIARVRETDDPADNETLAAVLRSRPYRLIAFGLDLLASVKLPGADALTK